MQVFCLCLSVSGGGDTYLLREERDDLSTDGTETLDNLRLRWRERQKVREMDI